MIEIIIFVVFWLNAFHPDIGIHQIYSPRKIIMNRNLEYIKNFRLDFETYAETHNNANPTKTVAERPKEAIFLGATKNFQRSHKFLSLRTGQIITREKFTSLPMPQSVIKKWKIWPSRKNTNKTLCSLTKNSNTLKVCDDDLPTG